MARPNLQVVLTDDVVPAGLPAALSRTQATVRFSPLREAVRTASHHDDDVVVVLPTDPTPIASTLGALLNRLAIRPRATLLVSAAGGPVARVPHPAGLPIETASGHDADELAGRLTAMLGLRTARRSSRRATVAGDRGGAAVSQRYARQLRVAQRVQREFFPDHLPRFGQASFRVVYEPVEYVSGDIFDVHALDAEHVGIAVVDAAEHGIPAALLTVYIKRALRGREKERGSYYILSPDEVLSRLNEDLLDAHLTDCPFVAAVYAVLNTRTLELSVARGGAPYPIYRQADGRTRLLSLEGGVVGVLPEARFEVATLRLAPGDSVLLYSDGLERIVAPPPALPGEHGAESVEGTHATIAEYRRQGVADAVAESAWLAGLARDGVPAALDALAERQRKLRRVGFPLDDLTALALRIEPS